MHPPERQHSEEECHYLRSTTIFNSVAFKTYNFNSDTHLNDHTAERGVTAAHNSDAQGRAIKSTFRDAIGLETIRDF